MKTFKQYLGEGASAGKHDLSPEQLDDHAKHAFSFGPGHMEAISDYKVDSNKFNEPLRHISQEHPQLYVGGGPADEHMMKHLDHVTGHPMAHDHTLYRGFSHHHKELDKLKVGDTFTDHGYTGTTTSEAVGKAFSMPQKYGHGGDRDFALHYAKIHAPAGTKGYYLDRHRNSEDYENEVLLHRGTKYQVTGHSEHTGEDAHETTRQTKYRVTHLRVVGNETK